MRAHNDDPIVPNDPIWIRRKELARLLGISYRTLRNRQRTLTKHGAELVQPDGTSIKLHRRGSYWYARIADLEPYL
jgi:hypothetical protein